jgi:hypothetical protein
MFAEWGRKADAALARGTDAFHEAVHATVLHLRRIVGAVSVALGRVQREAKDLVWDYQDVAGDLRRPADEPAPDERPRPQGRPELRVVGDDD